MAINGSGVLAYTLSSYSLHEYFYDALYRNGFGLYVKTSLESTPVVAVFPGAPSAVGEDVLLIDGVFYALAVEEMAVDEFVVSVHHARNPELGEWTQLLSFTSISRAKSFAWLDDGFYIGLGADLGEKASDEAVIMRRASHSPGEQMLSVCPRPLQTLPGMLQPCRK